MGLDARGRPRRGGDRVSEPLSEIEALSTFAWREGGLLVVPRGSALPPRCFRCGEAATESETTSVTWSPHGTSVVGAVLDSRGITLAVPMCARHAGRIRAFRRVGLVVGLASLVMVVLCVPASGRADLDWIAPFLGFAAVFALPVAYLLYRIGGTALRPTSIDEREAELRGCGESFLALLPTEPRFEVSRMRGRATTLSRGDFAVRPGALDCDERLLLAIQPELATHASWQAYRSSNARSAYWEHQFRGWWITHFKEHLFHAALSPAVVVSRSPLVVAAYSPEHDASVLVRFDRYATSMEGLRDGGRVLSVNMYASAPARDVVQGPGSSGAFGNFIPMIADVFCQEASALAGARAQISEAEWRRAEACAAEAVARGLPPRDGAPLSVSQPRSPGPFPAR
jgi:hypothetical protein